MASQRHPREINRFAVNSIQFGNSLNYFLKSHHSAKIWPNDEISRNFWMDRRSGEFDEKWNPIATHFGIYGILSIKK